MKKSDPSGVVEAIADPTCASTVDPVPEDDAAVLPCTSLASYFRSAVGKARQNQGLEATNATEYYVVSVLESFADADQLYGLDEEGNRLDEAMAITLCKALESHRHEKIDHFRRLGDKSLFLSGFFSESLRRRSVGVAYYIDMGQGAYASLSGMMKSRGGRVFRDIYGELAEAFADWVDVLREVSEEVSLNAVAEEQETGELYDRWTKARGNRATMLAMALMERGVLPSF